MIALPEEEKKEEKTIRAAVDAKESPPPEPVNVLPFQGKIKEGLSSPPPEPVEVPPFSVMKTVQAKEKSAQKTEGQE